MDRHALKVLDGLEGLGAIPAGAVLSVGNFDGVHLGHARILSTARRLKSESGASAVALVTFEPHPNTVLRPEAAPPRLTPPALKQSLLASAGADVLVNLPPSPEVLNLTAEQFWQILRDQVRPSHMVEGSTFNFGKGRGGTIQRLREWAAASAVWLDVIDPVTTALLDMTVVPVSSSLIRWLLFNGRVRDAAVCLGRPFALVGEVVKGYQRGRTIGVPTANLHCDEQLVPDDGVYAARCTVGGQTFPTALSIGTMPTFGNDLQRQVEAHLVGFDGDLYGQELRVDIVDWLRGQRRFNGIDVLKAQLQRDIQETIQRQTIDPARPVARAVCQGFRDV
jgi:riboflavin kinase/FMN adenylyltransferase